MEEAYFESVLYRGCGRPGQLERARLPRPVADDPASSTLTWSWRFTRQALPGFLVQGSQAYQHGGDDGKRNRDDSDARAHYDPEIHRDAPFSPMF
jgi:hypothetical protein